MKCKNCGYENMDEANFCINCGTKIEKDESNSDDKVSLDLNKEADQLITVDQNKEPVSIDDDVEQNSNSDEASDDQITPEWHFVENKESVGPFKQSQMVEFYQQGRITDSTYVWTQGMSNWVHLADTSLMGLINESKAAKEEHYPEKTLDQIQKETETFDTSYNDYSQSEPNKSEDWFYVDNGKSAGPYSQEAMISLINNGVLNPASYVWKEGMNAWTRLDQSNLSAFIPRNTRSSDSDYSSSQTYQNQYETPISNTVITHSVILYILLSILTCGIWYFVWVYMLARDINLIAARQQKPKGLDPVLSFILILLSCGVFQIFFFWKEENVLAQFRARNYQVQNQSILTGLLAIFCPLASAAIIQDQLNCLIKYE
ncbi:GYF domain-containing protein [Ileibacterium valens]|uniref:GYF domain-containing protein n=1 Tax=Ileibacterium valens TaxID=1862668 RepID=UPI00272B79A6|nr:GYF domain-containing protein [Ileibacterium valens]